MTNAQPVWLEAVKREIEDAVSIVNNLDDCLDVPHCSESAAQDAFNFLENIPSYFPKPAISCGGSGVFSLFWRKNTTNITDIEFDGSGEVSVFQSFEAVLDNKLTYSQRSSIYPLNCDTLNNVITTMNDTLCEK